MNKTMYVEELGKYINNSKLELISSMKLLNWGPIDPPKYTCAQKKEEASLLQRNNKSESYSLKNCFKDYLQNSKKCLSSSKANQPHLPEEIPKSFLACEKMSCIIDDSTRINLLRPLRGTEPIPAPALSADDYIAQYTWEEKNALYEYALKNTIKIQNPPELFCEEDVDAGETSENASSSEDFIKKMEMRKLLRDSKRRRQAYRRKVSTKNKSHTEVTREVISNIMEALFFYEDPQPANVSELSQQKPVDVSGWPQDKERSSDNEINLNAKVKRYSSETKTRHKDDRYHSNKKEFNVGKSSERNEHYNYQKRRHSFKNLEEENVSSKYKKSYKEKDKKK